MSLIAAHSPAGKMQLCQYSVITDISIPLTMLLAAANGNYVVPHTNRRLGDRAFSVAAPKAWNSLPTDLKIPTDAFKRRLKTWLFKRAYD